MLRYAYAYERAFVGVRAGQLVGAMVMGKRTCEKLIIAGGRFYPSGCGGHKNSENALAFFEFLGRRKNPPLRAEIIGVFTEPDPDMECCYRAGSGLITESILRLEGSPASSNIPAKDKMV